MHKRTIIFLFVIVALILIIAAFVIVARPAAAPLNVTAVINAREIKAEVAQTPAAIYRGLSGRRELCSNCGMLFMFPDKKERRFVMRDMRFPLDIIFIADSEIIKIAANSPSADNEILEIYQSDGPADQVLEINAGVAEGYGFKIGDQVLVKQID